MHVGLSQSGETSETPFSEWLDQNGFKNNRAVMRPSKALEAMKAKFASELRVDTSTPMWLEKVKTSKWLADQNRAEKDRRNKVNAEKGH